LSTRINEPIAPVPASQGQLRSARRLLRRKERLVAGRFLAEGRQAVAEALASVGAAVDVLVADDAVQRHQDLLGAAAQAQIPVAAASARDVSGLSDTVTPQGILAVCRTVDVPLADALAGSPRLVVLCDQVRDPGNLGTVIRCADAFGADAVLITAESVDVYNAKTVRASTGSIFHLPLVVDVDLAEAVDLGRAAGLAVLGADGAAEHTINDLARSGALAAPILWVLGNEAWGLPAEHLALIDRLVALPMYGRAESLNLSTAAAVILYATATAQRGR
jgi:TrmH family RNA methyltransferase